MANLGYFVQIGCVRYNWHGERSSVSNENPISAEGQLSNLLSKYHELFTDNYEGMKGLEAHITMKSNVKPIFVKAR